MTTRKIAVHPWPAGIIIFFLSLFAFETFLIVTAVGSRPTLVEESPYTKALSYDETRQKLIRAKDGGVDAEVMVSKKGDTDERVVTLRFSTPRGGDLSDVSLAVRRADTDSLDQQRSLVAIASASNTFTGTIRLPKKGLWFFEIDALINGEPLLMRKQIRVD